MADPVFTAKVERALATATPSISDELSFRQKYNLIGVDAAGDVSLPSGAPLFRSITWAELQALPALGNINRKVFVTDIGVNGSEWVSDGAAWRPLGPVTLVAEHQAQVVTDATADETDVFTYLIPAGLLTRNSLLKIYPAWTFPSSAATKVVRVLVGGVEAFSKSRTTTTHEVPIVEMMTQDGPTSAKFLLNPSGTYGSGQNGVLVSGNINLNEPIQIRATAKWGAASAGSNSITFHKCVVVLEY